MPPEIDNNSPTPPTPLSPTPENQPAPTPTAPEEFKPNPALTEAQNAEAKIAWQKTQDDAKAKAEADKRAAETPEAKAAREKQEKDAADKAAKDKANDTKATPFKAEEIKLPEGFQIDVPLQDRFVKLVNEKGIPRDVVANLIALQADTMKAASEAGSKLFADTQAAWQKEVAEDPTIGGDKTASVLAGISKLVDQSDDPAKLREVMDLTGFGNHPVAIKWLNKIVPMFVEPPAASSGKPGETQLSQADRIFGKK